MEVLENKVKDYWWGVRQWLYGETEKVQILLGPNSGNFSPYFIYEIIENSKPYTEELSIDVQRFFFSLNRAIKWIEFFRLKKKLLSPPCCYITEHYYSNLIFNLLFVLSTTLFGSMLFFNTADKYYLLASTDFIHGLTINLEIIIKTMNIIKHRITNIIFNFLLLLYNYVNCVVTVQYETEIILGKYYYFKSS
jgi:hypothetical protein